MLCTMILNHDTSTLKIALWFARERDVRRTRFAAVSRVGAGTRAGEDVGGGRRRR